MGGFIVLQDGRAYAASNWAYDCTIESIAKALDTHEEGHTLSAWLLEQRCSVQGPGLGSVDIRELTPDSRRMILEAIEKALRSAETMQPYEWHDSSAFPGWLARFQDLGKMVASIDRGEPPSAYNPHMRDLIPPSGVRKGPGWTVRDE